MNLNEAIEQATADLAIAQLKMKDIQDEAFASAPWQLQLIRKSMLDIFPSDPQPFELEIEDRYWNGHDAALQYLSSPPTIREDGNDRYYFVFASAEDMTAFRLAC